MITRRGFFAVLASLPFVRWFNRTEAASVATLPPDTRRVLFMGSEASRAVYDVRAEAHAACVRWMHERRDRAFMEHLGDTASHYSTCRVETFDRGPNVTTCVRVLDGPVIWQEAPA